MRINKNDEKWLKNEDDFKLIDIHYENSSESVKTGLSDNI